VVELCDRVVVLRDGHNIKDLAAKATSIKEIASLMVGRTMEAQAQANEYIGLGVGKVDTLFDEVRKAVRDHGVPLQEAIRVITTTPAGYLKLPGKGVIQAGADADLVLLDAGLGIHTVMAMGQIMMGEGEIKRFGTFERDMLDALEKKKTFLKK
jgi:beta-aspartyl-dipeptidase (metallo-type)